jgi:acylphosphatase
MAVIAVHLKIYGFVHGVSFRAGMARVADSQGVRGWVRNLNDGTVEALLEGDEKAVGKVADWAKRGPPRAVVKKVQTSRVPPKNRRDFRIES